VSLRVLVIGLVVASTAAFVVGVAIERSQGEGGGEQQSKPAAEGESGHVEGQGAEGESHAATESGHSESGETLLGINPESTGLLVVAVLTSLALAAAVALVQGSPLVPLVVGLAMLAFAALDVREVVHQINVSDTGLAILAGFVAALHLAAAGASAALARNERGRRAQQPN
jgi:hypothetical protein